MKERKWISYREQSKIDWGSEHEETNLDRLTLGCLFRVADALEDIAKTNRAGFQVLEKENARLRTKFNKRDREATAFCELYNKALGEIVELKTRLGQDPADY